MLISAFTRRAAAAAALSAVLLLGTTACSPDDGSSSSQSATTLDAAAFGERVASDGVVVLDVRTPEEFAAGVNVDLESGSFESDITGLDQAAPYAVYCRSGNRSGQAMGIMQDAGFTDVAHLDGGIVAWQEAGGQIVTD